MQTCSSQPPQSGTAGPGRHLTGGRPGQSGTKFQIRQTGPSIFRPSPARRGPGAKIGPNRISEVRPGAGRKFCFPGWAENSWMGRDGPGRWARPCRQSEVGSHKSGPGRFLFLARAGPKNRWAWPGRRTWTLNHLRTVVM